MGMRFDIVALLVRDCVAFDTHIAFDADPDDCRYR